MIRTSLRAGLCLLAAASAQAADWTSFKLGQLNSYTINYTHLPDGRFALGTGGTVSVQKTFGNMSVNAVPTGEVTVDPSFIAVSSATTGIVGAGGFTGPSGLHPFNPSTPASGITATAIATLQNYNGVFWKHPSSGREGWLIGGGNGTAGAHNITFVSTDGAHVGPVTGDLSTFSGGIAVDPQGHLYAALFETFGSPNEADAEKVFKFTAAQVDAAVAAVIAGTPAPVARASGTMIFQFQSAASLAVDELGRIWAAGFKTNHLQVFDPALNASRTFTPDHAPLANADGPPNYQVSTFTRNGVNHVSYLAIDSFYTLPSDIAYGYRPAEQLVVTMPQVAFDTAIQTVGEGAGTATFTISLSVPGTTRITVPFTLTGTAKKNADYTAATTPLVFERGETTKTITVTLKDDVLDEVDEILIATAGNPSPIWAAELGAQLTHTLTIADDDTPPQFAAGDTFLSARVGTSYAQTVNMLMDPNPTATRYSAKGLPPGLKIDPLTGAITGRPTIPGDYFEVVITAINASGTSRSQAFLLHVEDFPDAAKGSFIAHSARLISTDGSLGARLDISTTSVASFTGKLYFGGKTFKISGPLDTSTSNPTGSVDVLRTGKSTVEVDFVIDATDGTLTGTISDGSPAVSLTGWRALTATTLTGTHHFAAPLASPTTAQPAGATHGAITVEKNARTTIAGRLADGVSFSSSGLLGADGEVIVYHVMYAAPGSILGELEIESSLAQAVSGSLSWSKPLQPNTVTAHSDGWSAPITILATGGKYRPVSGSTIVLALPASVGTNAQLLFSGADVDSSLTEPDVSLRILAPATVAAPNIHKLKVDVKKGTFSGSITLQDGALKRIAAFEGRLIPDTSTPAVFDGTGQGFFLLTPSAGGPKASGLVRLTP